MKSHGISHRQLAWILFLSLCLAVGGWRAWENCRFRSASQAWSIALDQAQLQCEAQNKQAYQRISPLFGTLSRNGLSQAQTEQALGLGPPLLQSRTRMIVAPSLSSGCANVGKFECTYQDPVTKGHVLLYFREDGSWQGMSTSYPPGGAYPVPKPSRDRLFAICETVRPWIAGWKKGLGPLAWLVLLGLLIVGIGYRRVISECMLAVAIVCFLAWLLNPHYSLEFRGIVSNDMLFPGTIMLIVSAVTLAITSRRPPPPIHPECETCGYNLTGNVSGTCPECGTSLARMMLGGK